MQRKLKSLQNDCNESIIKEKGVEKDERKQAFRIQRKYKFQYFYEKFPAFDFQHETGLLSEHK